MDTRLQRAIAAVERMMGTSEILNRKFETLCQKETPEAAKERLARRLIMAFRQNHPRAVDEFLCRLSSEDNQWMRDIFPYQIFVREMPSYFQEMLPIEDAVLVSEYIASLSRASSSTG